MTTQLTLYNGAFMGRFVQEKKDSWHFRIRRKSKKVFLKKGHLKKRWSFSIDKKNRDCYNTRHK